MTYYSSGTVQTLLIDFLQAASSHLDQEFVGSHLYGKVVKSLLTD